MGDANGLSPCLEAIKGAALDLKALLKPAVETFSRIVRDDERVFAAATELWTNLIPWAIGAPSVEIRGSLK
jgi:hypothetical protein